MRRKFHLLNSPKYFSVSEEHGLFGVGERNINQLANIRRGDILFYYTAHKVGHRTSGFIHGPYEVTSELFYNPEVVWVKDANDTDKYPFRIKFKYLEEHVCLNPVPVQVFWDLKEEGKIKTIIDSSALIDKAVTTLLEEEGVLLLQALLQANFKSGKYTKGYRSKDLVEHKINLLKLGGTRVKEFEMEAYLEAYLLKNPQIIHKLSGFENGLSDKYSYEVLNQVSTYIAGGAIDIVCVYQKKVLDMWLKIGVSVFELKKGVIDPSYVEQVIRYIEWASRLIPGVKKSMIKGVMIGRNFGNQSNKKAALIDKINDLENLYDLEGYTYSVTRDNHLVFDRLE